MQVSTVSSPVIAGTSSTKFIQVEKDVKLLLKNEEKKKTIPRLALDTIFTETLQKPKSNWGLVNFVYAAADWVSGDEKSQMIQNLQQTKKKLDSQVKILSDLNQKLGNKQLDDSQRKELREKLIDAQLLTLQYKLEMNTQMLDIQHAHPELLDTSDKATKKLIDSIKNDYFMTVRQFRHLVSDQLCDSDNISRLIQEYDPELAPKVLDLQKSAIAIQKSKRELETAEKELQNLDPSKLGAQRSVMKKSTQVAKKRLQLEKSKEALILNEQKLLESLKKAPTQTTKKLKGSKGKKFSTIDLSAALHKVRAEIGKAERSVIASRSVLGANVATEIGQKYNLSSGTNAHLLKFLGEKSNRPNEKKYLKIIYQMKSREIEMAETEDPVQIAKLTLENNKDRLVLYDLERGFFVGLDQSVQEVVNDKASRNEDVSEFKAIQKELEGIRRQISHKSENLRKEIHQNRGKAKQLEQEKVLSGIGSLAQELKALDSDQQIAHQLRVRLDGVKTAEDLTAFKKLCDDYLQTLTEGGKETGDFMAATVVYELLQVMKTPAPVMEEGISPQGGGAYQIMLAGASDAKRTEWKVKELKQHLLQVEKGKAKIAAHLETDHAHKVAKQGADIRGQEAWERTTLGKILTEYPKVGAAEDDEQSKFAHFRGDISKTFVKKINSIKVERRKLHAEIETLEKERKRCIQEKSSAKTTVQITVLEKRVKELDEEIKPLKEQDLYLKLQGQKNMLEAITSKVNENRFLIKQKQKELPKKQLLLEMFQSRESYLTALIENRTPSVSVSENYKKDIASQLTDKTPEEQKTYLNAQLKIANEESGKMRAEIQNIQHDIKEAELRLETLDRSFDAKFQKYAETWRPPNQSFKQFLARRAKRAFGLHYLEESPPPSPNYFRQKKKYADVGYNMFKDLVAWKEKVETNPAYEGQPWEIKIKTELYSFLDWAVEHPEAAAHMAADISQVAAILMEKNELDTFNSTLKAKVFSQGILTGVGVQPVIEEIEPEELMHFRALSDLCRYAPAMAVIGREGGGAVADVGNAFTTGGLTAGLCSLVKNVAKIGIEKGKQDAIQDSVTMLSFEQGKDILKFSRAVAGVMRNDVYFDSIAEQESLVYATSLGNAYTTFKNPGNIFTRLRARWKDRMRTIKYSDTRREKFFRILAFSSEKLTTFVDKSNPSCRRRILKKEAEHHYQKERSNLLKFRSKLVDGYIEKFLLPKKDAKNLRPLKSIENWGMKKRNVPDMRQMERELTQGLRAQLHGIKFEETAREKDPAQALAAQLGPNLHDLRTEARKLVKEQTIRDRGITPSDKDLDLIAEHLVYEVYNNLIESWLEPKMDEIIEKDFLKRFENIYHDLIVKKKFQNENELKQNLQEAYIDERKGGKINLDSEFKKQKLDTREVSRLKGALKGSPIEKFMAARAA